MEIPEIRYATTADGLNIAYQQVGSGPDLVFVPGLVSNIEISWEHELYRRAMLHTADHTRAVQFDKRGIGCSDRWEHDPTLDVRISDILAVFDAAEIERAHVVGVSEGGLMAAQFAIRHPERVNGLILANPVVGANRAAEYGEYGKRTSEALRALVETWGRDGRTLVEWFVPTQSTNEEFVRFVARFQRQSGARSDIARQIKNMQHLETPSYSQISVPTMVLASSGDRLVPAHLSRRTAELIPGAQLVEIDTPDHFYFAGDAWRETLDVGLEFLLGHRLGTTGRRAFATVLFTDLVDSTNRSHAVGDDRWRDAIDSHNRMARQIVLDGGGTYVKSTGDGLLAYFQLPSEAAATALRLRDALTPLGFSIRAGLHAGEIEVHDDGDISGLSVNLAARIEQRTAEGAVWVSSTVRDLLLGGDFTATARGDHELKGIAGTWQLYELGHRRAMGAVP